MKLYCHGSPRGIHDFDEVEFSQFCARLSEDLRKEYVMSYMCPECFLKTHPELENLTAAIGVSAP